MARMIPGRRWMAVALALVAAAAIAALLIYKGRIRLNHPSREKYPIRGVDVSHHQGRIDFARLAEQDVQFAYIKATEGSSYTDECLADNAVNAQAAGLRVGFYHFFSYDSAGLDQAAHFASQVPSADGLLPPVIDVELYGDYAHAPAMPDSVIPELRAMADALEERYGVKPVLYCTARTYRLYIRGAFDDCGLWIRSVYTAPHLDRPWTFWQYSDKDVLEGYAGAEKAIDLNVFAGTLEEFQQYPR